jgi:hypothetical protein
MVSRIRRKWTGFAIFKELILIKNNINNCIIVKKKKKKKKKTRSDPFSRRNLTPSLVEQQLKNVKFV